MTSLRTAELDVHRIRAHFDLARSGRIVTNNAASTQPPRQLLDLYRSLIPSYENVHRGQSTASQGTTALFEESYDTIAGWLNAPSRRSIATYRNTTEAHNAVMYSLLTEFRDGDNVVDTMLEHNSNFVPWYALCREILPRLGRRVECRIARFDHVTGRAGPGSSCVAGGLADQAGVLHRRVQLPRHQARPGDGSGHRRPQRLSAARRGVPITAAGRRRAAGADEPRRRSGAGRRLPVVLVPQVSGAVRRRRVVRQGAPAASSRCRFCTAGT